ALTDSTFRSAFMATSSGVGGSLMRARPKAVAQIPIPIAPLNEQRRIVDKLDRIGDRQRSARNELNHIPKLIARYKQAVLAAACSGKLTEDWREKKGLPKSCVLRLTLTQPYERRFFAPEHWQNYCLGEVCNFIGGSQPPKSDFSYTPQTGYIRLIQIRDYKSDDFLTYVPIKSVRRFCNANDVMIGRYGPPIFQILRGLEGAYNVALMKAEPALQDVDLDFIFYFLQDPDLFKYIEIGSDRTAGQSGVNKNHLEKYPAFIPPLEEQKEIVQRVEKMFAKIGKMEEEYQKAVKLCDRLEQATLAKAFRGELVAQDPDDEPASVLLEQVKREKQVQPKGKSVKSK
ncbi:MAG: restriction endonuclease subunit S, partial [Pseudanabaena sp.]